MLGIMINNINNIMIFKIVFLLKAKTFKIINKELEMKYLNSINFCALGWAHED